MRYHGKATISPRRPEALAVCDRCGALYNHKQLQYQSQWMGPRLQNLRILVCRSCLDVPNEQLRTIVLPPDPVPIAQPRPEAYATDVNPISGLGTNLGTMSNLASAFNGVTSKPSAWCCISITSESSFNTVGKQWNAPTQPVPVDDQTVNINRFTVYAPSDGKFLGSGAASMLFQGSSDGTTWTTLYSTTSAGTVGESIDVTSPTGGNYSYHRLAIVGDGTPVTVAQLVLYGTGLQGQNI